MQLEEYFDFVEPDVIRLKGHRIFLEHIVERWLKGSSPERIVQELPTLDLEDVYATIAYYLHNKAVVDAYLERGRLLAEEAMRAADANPDAVTLRLRALKERQRQERAHAHP
jgi:uncharacterized protein (DUF433 family)